MPRPRPEVEFSIVVPVHNEALGLDRFFDRLLAVLGNLGATWEIICIDDGSTDSSLEHLNQIRARVPGLKLLSLSRNFGKDVALCAGLDYARGAAVIPIDSDLQDPPELIPDLVAKWREGFDVVYATRQRRSGETLVKRATARLFYRVLERLTDTPVPRDTGDFRLLDRRVVDALAAMPERTRFMKGLFAWVGFKQTSILYDREARTLGASKWSYWRLWNFAIDAITSMSSLPLKIWSYLGLIISLFAFLYAVFLAALKLLRGIDVPGYTSLMVVVLFLGGVQLVTLGVVGEYLARIYNEVKRRPLYIVRDAWGFDHGRGDLNGDK